MSLKRNPIGIGVSYGEEGIPVVGLVRCYDHRAYARSDIGNIKTCTFRSKKKDLKNLPS